MAGFRLSRDFFHERGEDEKSRVGLESAIPYKGGKTKCRVYDDDGNLYYEADCDGDDGAELFHNWAMYDSGCTGSKIKPVGQRKYDWFIG